VRVLAWILVGLACLTPAGGQTAADSAVRTWYVPALGYGPNAWSIVRLTNSSDAARPVRIEVFRENGEPLPFDPEITVAPGSSRDLRIEMPSSKEEWCWVRISAPGQDSPALEVRAFLEILRGNAIEDFPREAHAASDRARWVSKASNVEGKELYFLNVAARPTTVAFCGVKQPGDECRKRGGAAAHYLVESNRSLSVQVRKLRQRYFAIESSAPEAAIVVLFTDGPGTTKVFGSDSSIRFGDTLP
jgi:hypothetical protein